MPARRSIPIGQPLRTRASSLICLAFLALLGGLTACGDADGPLYAPHQGGTVQIPLAPRFHAAAANYAGAPVNRVRITARNVATGDVVGTAVVDVDPTQSSWQVPFEVSLPPGSNVTLEVLITLVNVTGGVETVEWSGRVTIPNVVPGQTQQVQNPPMVPGPPENLSITGVSITGDAGPVQEGATLNLAAAVQGGGANPTVVWSSLTPDIATVDQSGLVTTLRPGTARVQVLAGSHTDTHDVEVVQRAAGITLTPASQTLNALGAQATFTAAVVDPRGAPLPGSPEVTWSVLEGGAVTMTGPGQFRAVQNGGATVQAVLASDPTIKATGAVTVAQEVAAVKVTPASRTVDGLGSTATYTAAAVDANDNPVSGVTFTWSTDDPAVATVDGSGTVTTKGKGTTGVHAMAGSVGGSATVTVTQTVARIEVTPEEVSFNALGAHQQLTAQAVDVNGNPVEAVLTWFSANPVIALVSPTGLVTAQSNGQAYVFVNGPNGSRADRLVTIQQVVADIQLEPAEHRFDQFGQTHRFNATPVDANSRKVGGVDVELSSSDPSVVAVTDHGDGTATAQATGNGATFVVARSAGVEVSAPVKVEATGPGQINGPILLYHADGSYAANALKSGLVATERVSGSNIHESMMQSTPLPLTTLTQFGCVIVWTNFSPSSPVAIGDRLQEYVDAGGQVVMAVYAYSPPSSPWELQGGIMAPNYSPFVPSNTELYQFNRQLDFSSALPGHPLLQGVTEFSYGGNSNYAAPTVNGGGTVVAHDNYGVPLLGVNGASSVVGINVYPGDVFHKSPGVYETFINACTLRGPITGGTVTLPEYYVVQGMSVSGFPLRGTSGKKFEETTLDTRR